MARRNRESSRIDLTGQQFGDLIAVRMSEDNHNKLLWECHCSCGNTTYVPAGSLRAGTYRSCGCKRVAKRDQGVKEHIQADRVDGTRKTALTAKLHKGNKSGHKGVIWREHKQKWAAYIGFQGKQISLGHYESKEEAMAARIAGEEKFHKPYLEDDNNG